MLVEGFHPRYARTGHIVFARANSLWAVPFDSDRLEVLGEPTPVVEDVQVDSGGLANFALANDGSLAYVPSAQANRTLVRVDQEGRVEQLQALPGEYWGPTISPDGRRIALRIGTGESDLWIYEWERDIMTRLTFDPALDQWPVWTPDGTHVVFRSDRAGATTNLYAIPADGSGSARRLTESEGVQFPDSWSPDGKVLAMIEIPPGGRHDILTLPLEAEAIMSSEPGTPEPFVTSTAFVESKPAFSPDGRFIAYESDESGQVEIHVRPFPGPGGKWQVSNAGGGEPRWSPKGGELFYRNEGALFAVPYTVQGGSFRAGTPRVLFEGTFFSQQLYRWYDVFPDGEHFLMMQTVESETPELVFIVNWFEELKRLVPAN